MYVCMACFEGPRDSPYGRRSRVMIHLRTSTQPRARAPWCGRRCSESSTLPLKGVAAASLSSSLPYEHRVAWRGPRGSCCSMQFSFTGKRGSPHRLQQHLSHPMFIYSPVASLLHPLPLVLVIAGCSAAVVKVARTPALPMALAVTTRRLHRPLGQSLTVQRAAPTRQMWLI